MCVCVCVFVCVQEVRPERVTWKWQQLMAGTSSVTYTAVAATEGTFTLPPVKASADDQPEVGVGPNEHTYTHAHT